MKFVIFAIIAVIAAVGAKPYHTDDFLHFYTLHEMEHYLEHLEEDNPELVFLEKIGTTSEGRDITAVHVSVHDHSKHHLDKPKIMVESGLHAREWIAPMVNLYLIHMFVEHPDHQKLLEKVDLLFIPMANPDGYVYSHETDRNWNKNRRVVNENCIGVDLNRNFGFQFRGSVEDTCDENYPGEWAFSEEETMAIEELIEKYQEHIKVYLSLQAFGTQILTPYNYANEQYEGQREITRLGYKIASAIRGIKRTNYQVGVGARLLPAPEFGTSSDYAFGGANIPTAFTIKLPRGGETGFDVPEDQLDGILSETFVGFLELVTSFVERLPVPLPA